MAGTVLFWGAIVREKGGIYYDGSGKGNCSWKYSCD